MQLVFDFQHLQSADTQYWQNSVVQIKEKHQNILYIETGQTIIETLRHLKVNFHKHGQYLYCTNIESFTYHLRTKK